MAVNKAQKRKLFVRMAIILMSTLILLVSPRLLIADAILQCTFSRIATFDPKGKDDVKAVVSKDDPWVVIFAGLDSASPKLKGNMGESSLEVIRRESDGIWLAEKPLLGGVNIWTVFFSTRIAILSKQYTIGGKPFGMMSMGHCK